MPRIARGRTRTGGCRLPAHPAIRREGECRVGMLPASSCHLRSDSSPRFSFRLAPKGSGETTHHGQGVIGFLTVQASATRQKRKLPFAMDALIDGCKNYVRARLPFSHFQKPPCYGPAHSLKPRMRSALEDV